MRKVTAAAVQAAPVFLHLDETVDKTVAMIDFNLAVSQLAAGQYGEGATTSKEAIRLDPSRQAQLDKFAVTVLKNLVERDVCRRCVQEHSGGESPIAARLAHGEDGVARQCSVGRHHLDAASGSTIGYGRLDQRW